MASGSGVFEDIAFPKKALTRESVFGYRVYKNPVEAVYVEAEMASEAIAKSGIAAPYKVVRVTMEMGCVLDPRVMVEVGDALPEGIQKGAQTLEAPQEAATMPASQEDGAVAEEALAMQAEADAVSPQGEVPSSPEAGENTG